MRVAVQGDLVSGLEDLLYSSGPALGRDARHEERALDLVCGEELEDPGNAYARPVGLVRHSREVLGVVGALGEYGSLGIHIEGEHGDRGGTLTPVSGGRKMICVHHHAPPLVVPPFGCTTWPTRLVDPSRARNATVAATSSGRTMRPPPSRRMPGSTDRTR